MDFPKEKYDIIYADPPWSYDDQLDKSRRLKYKTQSIEWIKNLPVKKISKDNCILFLWVTMPKLNECFEVIDAWGFQFKTGAFVWIKKYKKSSTLFYGMGRWTRSNPELCLLCTKGKPKRKRRNIHSVVLSNIERHSKKPDEVRRRIELLMGRDKKKIELFARQRYIGWDAWGNEVENAIPRRRKNLGILRYINNRRYK